MVGRRANRAVVGWCHGQAESGQQVPRREVGGRSPGQLDGVVTVERVHPVAPPRRHRVQEKVPRGPAQGVETPPPGRAP
ncbi:hypothetical protein ACFV00_33800, partial [Streptomyces californicus]|uniref:hypothetical protein n=1 Tax=Streptomyces californicus TaxID=67351 RepID=UPI00368FF8D5